MQACTFVQSFKHKTIFAAEQQAQGISFLHLCIAYCSTGPVFKAACICTVHYEWAHNTKLILQMQPSYCPAMTHRILA